MLSLLAIVVVAVGCNPSSNPDVACDPSGCISLTKFAGNIFDELDGKVTGEVIMVGGTFPLVGGLARTNADPPSFAMSILTPIDVASVGKVLTTVGVLQSLAKHNMTVDDKILPYLWSDWQKGKNIDTITFRDLLTHKAGFRSSCDSTYEGLKDLIQHDVKMPDKAVSSYHNCNFSIFREMIPFMEGASYSGTEDGRAQWSAAYYVNYMNAHVFTPLGMGNQACKSDPNTVAFSYPFPAGSAHGHDWGDTTLRCGAGGWVMSGRDLFEVVNDLANGNVLLTNVQKAEMNASYPSSLGWDSSLTSDICPNPYVCKNGGLDDGYHYLRSYIGIFKCKVPVVVLINSKVPDISDDLTPLVKKAYKNAGVSESPGPCSAQPTLPPPPLPPTPSNGLKLVTPSPSLLPFKPALTVQPMVEFTATPKAP